MSRLMLVAALALLLPGAFITPFEAVAASGTVAAAGRQAAGPVFLPVLRSSPQTVRTIHAPYFSTSPVSFPQSAIAWFGKVDYTTNYTDVRVGYNNVGLVVNLHTFDRRLYWNEFPTPATLTQYDSSTLYLDLDGNLGGALTTNTYRFDMQLYLWGDISKFRAGYRWDGTGWKPFAGAFTTTSGYDGFNGPNTGRDDNGWWSEFTIPFASLGLSGPPAQGTQWGMGLAVHDRDDAARTPIPDTTWPETMAVTRPSTWGLVGFGLPSYTAPNKPLAGSVTLRDKINGAVVTDAAVGGTIGNLCNSTNDFWAAWGNANFAGGQQINIQNQWLLGDWRCFSKFYLTFALDNVPHDKVILSANLTLHLFGGSDPTRATPSLIQVLSLSEDWNESTITWNNGPLALENVSRAWVYPTAWPGWPGIPYTWDVTYALVKALNSGQPLRLAMYSADWDMHSGKYFYSSDADVPARPALVVTYANP